MTARSPSVAEPDRFQDLLVDLQAEHERALASLREERLSVVDEEHAREVSTLRAEISRLQTQKQQRDQQDDGGTVSSDLSRACSRRANGRTGPLMVLSTSRASLPQHASRKTSHATSRMSMRSPEKPMDRSISMASSRVAQVVLNDSIASLRSAWRKEALQTPCKESPSLDDLDALGCGLAGRRLSRRRSRRPSRLGQQPESRTCVSNISSMIAPFSPASETLLYWDLLGVAFICYDMLAIPLLVYDPPKNWFTMIMDWLILLFWTMSILVTFNSGFYKKGNIEMSRKRIFFHYVTGWLLLDLLVVGPDWVLGAIDTTTSQNGDVSRLLRTGRVVRNLRLLRVVKLQRVITKLYDKIDSEYMFIMADMCKMICFILAMCHLIACGWFLVGKFADDLNWPTWISWSEDFWKVSMGYQYATSLHWTLTQFTPASMDVVARNLLERIYSILVLLLAMTTFSSFVGTVTSSITSLRNMRGDKQKSFWLLRRYLKQNRISFDLSSRMNRFIEHQLNDQARVVLRSNVKILAHISDGMAHELAYEQYAPCLNGHAFFHYLSNSMMVVASRICHTALKSQHLAMGDVVFQASEEAQACCILKGGHLEYTRIDGMTLAPPPGEREWMAEAALWTQWWFCGSCFATGMSEVIWVLGDKFTDVMAIHPRPWALAQGYGEKFIRYLNQQGPANWLDVLRDESFYENAVDEAVEDMAMQNAWESSEEGEREANSTRDTMEETDTNPDCSI